jgi:hypothetical protein
MNPGGDTDLPLLPHPVIEPDPLHELVPDLRGQVATARGERSADPPIRRPGGGLAAWDATRARTSRPRAGGRRHATSPRPKRLRLSGGRLEAERGRREAIRVVREPEADREEGEIDEPTPGERRKVREAIRALRGG